MDGAAAVARAQDSLGTAAHPHHVEGHLGDDEDGIALLLEADLRSEFIGEGDQTGLFSVLLIVFQPANRKGRPLIGLMSPIGPIGPIKSRYLPKAAVTTSVSRYSVISLIRPSTTR